MDWMYVRAAFVAMVLGLAGCAHEESSVVAAPIAPARQGGAAQPPGPRDLAGVTIHMERKACYGICPSYFVDISGDGQVTYEGREFVYVRGQKKGTADPGQVSHLMDVVDRLQLTTLVDPPPCARNDTDQPTVIVSIRDRGATTNITHNLGNGCYPKELTDLEAMIDDVAHSWQWVRCETGFCLN